MTSYFVEATTRRKNHPVCVLRCIECREIFRAFTVATELELLEWSEEHKCSKPAGKEMIR